MSEYPEHDKLAPVAEYSQAIGEFLDLGPWTLCRFNPESRTQSYTPIPIDKALAEWFGIDQEKLDEEKRAMLRSLRERDPTT